MFKNDWLVANINNPNTDLYDLTTALDLTTDNTLFLSKSEYLKSDFIKNNELFKDEEGNFSEERFNKFYDYQALQWLNFHADEYPKGLALNYFDTDVKPDSRVKDIGFYIGEDFNPDRVLIGIEGFRTISDRTKSPHEIAQSSKIYDSATGEYLDYSPDDTALFSNPIKWVLNLFKDPLVLATYDEDEIDEKGVEHKKGQYKYNDLGTYYYETLNGRSPIGKLVLSIADLITREDSNLNGIDFLDSDDLKKSPVGVVAKNLALLSPLLTPIAPYYITAIIAKEMVRTLPMLYSISLALFNEDNEVPERLRTLSAKMEQLTTSSSMWSKEHTFSFENFVNLASDVVLQWGLQKNIAKAVSWFGNKDALKQAEKKALDLYREKMGGKFAELGTTVDGDWKETVLGSLCYRKFADPVIETISQRQKLGGSVALAYMSMISNTDVYNNMIELGATRKEAALVALGSTVGMFGFDKYTKLGELFYDDVNAGMIQASRKVVKDELARAAGTIYGNSKQAPLQWYKLGLLVGKKAAQKFVLGLEDHSLGLGGKALGEGLEELGEEVITDLAKATYVALGELGAYDRSILNPIDFEHMGDRYLMSFLGGALGGSIFYGYNKYLTYDAKRDKDLVDIIRENGTADLINLAKKELLRGNIVNNNLSGSLYDDSNGNLVWLTAKDKNDTQALAVYNRFVDKVNAIAATIGPEYKLSDDLLFDKMVMRDARYATLKLASHVTGYYEEFSRRLEKYNKARTALIEGQKTVSGDAQDTRVAEDSEKPTLEKEMNLTALLEAVTVAKLELDLFLSGDSALEYTRKLNFALDPVLNSVFLDLDKGKWFIELFKKGETYKDLKELIEAWNEHVKTKMLNLDAGFEAFLKLEKDLIPELYRQLELAKTYIQTNQLLELLHNLDDIGSYLEKIKAPNWNTLLPDESPEDFEVRDNLNTPEEVIKYIKRRQAFANLKRDAVKQYIDLLDQIFAPLEYNIDSSTNRAIIQNILKRIKDVIIEELDFPTLIGGSYFNNTKYNNTILKTLNPDLSNLNKVILEVLAQYIFDLLEYNRVNFDEVKVSSRKIPLEIFNPGNFEKMLNTLEGLDEEAGANIKLYNSNPDFRKNLRELIVKSGRDIDGIISDLGNIRSSLYSSIFVELGANLKDGSKNNEIIAALRNKLISEKESLVDTSLTTLFEKVYDTFGEITIGDLLESLEDPNSEISVYLNFRNPELINIIKDKLTSELPYSLDSIIDVLYDPNEESESSSIEKFNSSAEQYVQALGKRILSNPIYEFYQKLKVQSKSPLENIFKSIGKQLSDTNDELFDITYILDKVYQDYIGQEFTKDFKLNDTQAKLLNNAAHVLELTKAYIYAASGNLNSFFGLNKQINEFADKHKDLISKKWEPLPEIDVDYANVLLGEIGRLGTEISLWLLISENNRMNKVGRLVRSEEATNIINYNLLKNLSATFTIDDKEYTLDAGALGDFDGSLLKLYNAEYTLYSNFLELLKETGLDLETFFAKSQILEKLIGNPDLLDQQIMSHLTEDRKDSTVMDRAMYFLTVLSENPTKYYLSLKNFLKDNDKIVPLTALLMDARIAEAMHSDLFKAGMDYLSKYTDKYVASNSVHINGVAGAGKTDVVLKKIRQRFNDEEALILGPTKPLAEKLLKILNEVTSYTFDEIFGKIITNWKDIRSAYDNLVPVLNKEIKELSRENRKSITKSSEFFDLNYIVTELGIGASVTLKPEAIQFNPEFKLTLVFADEAAHLNTLLIALLDLFAKHNNGTSYLASDDNQSGYLNGRVENLAWDAIFMPRTYKLSESLRSENILKQENNNKINNILDTFNYLYNNNDTVSLENFLSQLPTIVKNLSLRVYNKEDINGDLLDADLDEVISKLPKDAHIGFIGDSESDAYKKLKASGFDNLDEALTEVNTPGKPFMQGLEFDYVIIDNINIPEKMNGYEYITFLRRLNTLSTRGKKAAIFLSDQLSKTIGENILDDIKSKGFDIMDLVGEFRDVYIDNLEKLKLIEESEEVQREETEDKGISTAHVEKEGDPEEEMKKGIKELFELVDKNTSEPTTDMAENLSILANTVVPITGMLSLYTNADGSPRKYPRWVPAPKSNTRRNLSAFVSKELTSRKDKLDAQDIISAILSGVIYGSPITNLELKNKLGFEEAWKNRKLFVEAREVTDYDHFGIGTDLKENFITIKGKKYIVSIVCLLDNLRDDMRSPKYTALIDVCLLADVNKLKIPEEQLKIKNAINERIKKGLIADIKKAELERDNLIDSIKLYEKLILDLIDNGRIELTPEMYKSHKYTKLIKRDTPRRLGGDLDLHRAEKEHIIDSEGNYPADYHTFMEIDKRKVVSPVYIVGNQSDILKGKISENVFGKAVVFVSGNKSLNPNDLALLYIEQKKNPHLHTPEVRMVILNNTGLSMTDLITERSIKALGTTKPWSMNVMGIRMFTAMWNFRAGLQNFLEELKTWKTKNGYNEAKIKNITLAERDIFEGKKTKEEALKAYKITEKDLENLTNFNEQICKEIPMFRLGSTKKGYVREFNVSDSSKYTTKKANMLMVTEDLANTYLTLINTILNLLSSNKLSPEYLAIGFKPMNTKLVKANGKEYDSREYIGRDEQNRNLSGLIHTKDKEIIIGELDDNGKVLTNSIITPESIFSFFPRAITSLLTRVKAYQNNEGVNLLIRVSTIDKDDNKDSFNIDASALIDDIKDNNIFDMFNFMLHGSIENINEAHATVSGVPYPKGIFVDPDLEHADKYELLNIQGNNGKNYTLLKCGTNPNYFTVNVDAVPGGMELYLDKVKRKKKTDPKPDEDGPKPPPLKEKKFSDSITDEEERNRFIGYALNNGLPNSLETYNKFVKHTESVLLKGWFNSGSYSDKLLKIISREIGKEVIRLDIIGENHKYYLENGELGNLYLNPDMSVVHTVDEDNNAGAISLSMDSKVKDCSADGAEICSHREFIDTLADNNPDDEIVMGLANSENVEAYLKGIEEYKNHLLLVTTDPKLLNYLMWVDQTC